MATASRSLHGLYRNVGGSFRLLFPVHNLSHSLLDRSTSLTFFPSEGKQFSQALRRRPADSLLPWVLSFLPWAAALEWNRMIAEAQETKKQDQHEDCVETAMPDNPPTSNSHTARWRLFTDTGRDLFSQGRMDEAEKYLTQALEEAKLGFGPNDPHVASACNNLAELFRVRKQFDRAEGLYLEAIERLKATMGPFHYSVGLALHNLGGVYLQQRRYESAKTFYEESLKIKQEALGPQHPECAATMFHLGEVLRLMGLTEDSMALIRGSLKILEEGGGGHTQSAVRRTGRLAEMLAASGDLKEAENLQRKVLHIVETTQGSESLAGAAAAESLAGTLQARGQLEESEQLLELCLRIRVALLGPEHFQVGGTLDRLAHLVELKGEKFSTSKKIKEASEEFQRASAQYRRAIRIAEHRWSQMERRISLSEPRLVTGCLVALVRPLAALGETLLSSSSLPEASKAERDAALIEAETSLRRCLSLLRKADLPIEVTKNNQLKKLHLTCLRGLERVLKQRSLADSAKEQEELQRQATALES